MEIVCSMEALYVETEEIMEKYRFTETFETLRSAFTDAIERHIQAVWSFETEHDMSRSINTTEISDYVELQLGDRKTIEWLQHNPNANLRQWLYTLGTALKLQVVEREYTPRRLAIADWKFINEE